MIPPLEEIWENWVSIVERTQPTTFSSVQFSRSVVSDSATPWTAAYQAPLSMGFSRQEYRSGVPLPSLPGFSVHHQFLELAQTHVHWVGDAIQPSLSSILSRPLLLPSILLSIRERPFITFSEIELWGLVQFIFEHWKMKDENSYLSILLLYLDRWWLRTVLWTKPLAWRNLCGHLFSMPTFYFSFKIEFRGASRNLH